MSTASNNNHQHQHQHQHHPPSSSADIATSQAAHSSAIDAHSHLSNSGYAPNENQLAGLVEAATAAAGQDVSDWAAAAAVAAAAGAAGNQHHLDGYGPEIHIEDDGFSDAGFSAGLGTSSRHLRPPGSGGPGGDHGPPSGLSRTVSKKRKRDNEPLDPALTAGVGLGAGAGAPQHQHNHQHHASQQYEGDGLDIRPVPTQSLSDSRSVGLHSAAALFRQPSSNKKHTRPPMSKMFTSLEMSPENFLQLQSAAKNYMLDESRPERQDCVGQRGKGDSELVKLRLWNCVRHFLEAEGNGERFFGEHVVNSEGPRTIIWPRDQHKIIALVIPLLRRMVTNERQRQYAIETRKGGGPEERRRRRTVDGFPSGQSASPPAYTAEEHLQMHAHQQQQQQQQQEEQEHRHIQQQQQQQQQQQSLPETFAAPLPAPTAPAMPASGQQNMQLGLADLLMEGYPTDWEAAARSYDMYNNDMQLDNLWSLSGLLQPDWRGLVASVDSHYQIYHHGDHDCPQPCEDEYIRHILEAESMGNVRWRVGGNRFTPARNEFASGITRDISRIIRDSIAAKHGAQLPSYDQQSASTPQPYYGQHNQANNNHASSHTPVLRINVIHDGKRIFPRIDVSAEQCPDLNTLKHTIVHRFSDRLASVVPDHRPESAWKVKVFVPDGLSSVSSDGEWTIALLSAATVDWMDNEMKVVIDLDGGSSS